MNECYNVVVVKVATAVRGGWGSRSANRDRALVLGGGGVSKNQIAVATVARLFFLTAVAIAIATRPFKFREISVSNSTSSFVSSIHSLECTFTLGRGEESQRKGRGATVDKLV